MNMNSHTEYGDLQVAAPADGVRGFTLPEVLGVITQSWRLIAGIVILATLAGISHMLIAQPTYRADALLHVNRSGFGLGSLSDFSDLSSLFYGLEVKAEAEVLQSRGVLGTVVDKLDLNIIAQPARLPLVGAAIVRADITNNVIAGHWFDRNNPWFDLESWLGLQNYSWANEHIDVERFDVPEALLGKTFTVVAGKDSQYKLLGYGHQLLLERGKVGEHHEIGLPGQERFGLFISTMRGAPGTRFKITKEPQLKAIENLNKSLTIEVQAEETDSGEAATSGLLSVSFDGPDPQEVSGVLEEILNAYLRLNVQRQFSTANTTQKLLEEQLSTVKKQMEDTEAALNQYRFKQGSVDLERETSDILGKIVDVENKLSMLQANRMELLQKFTSQSTRVALLDSQISTVESELAGLDSTVRALPETQQKILSLSREAKVNRHFYTLLSNKAQELKVVKAGTIGNAYILDPVAIPFEPIRPRTAFVIPLYVVLGGLLGVGAVFLRKSLRGVVDDPDEIEQQLGLPVYAVVPYSSKQKKCAKGNGRKGLKRTVLAARDPQDIAVESLRSLRTWMNFALLEARNNVLLVTGPGPGVGKTFVSVNLGAVWANAGKRVLVIDADLRRGHLHHYFGRERDGGGLSNVIAGDIRLSQAIHETQINGLSIITGGTLLPNPSELLMHESFATLLKDCSSRFDHVIIDSPPILAVTDAAILGRLAAAALLVLKANTHPLREVEQSAKRLSHAGVHLRGVVVNGMDTSSRYGYGRYYGYNYTYSSKRGRA